MPNSWHKLFFPRIAILVKAKMTNTECAAIEINYVHHHHHHHHHHNNNNNNNNNSNNLMIIMFFNFKRLLI